MLQGQAQPGFRRELECSACKVPVGDIAGKNGKTFLFLPNNIGMANNDLITVFFLVRLCAMEILPEGSFYPGSILISVHLDIILRDFLKTCW